MIFLSYATNRITCLQPQAWHVLTVVILAAWLMAIAFPLGLSIIHSCIQGLGNAQVQCEVNKLTPLKFLFHEHVAKSLS